MLNKVQLIGNTGADGQIKYTQTGKQVVSFSIATSKSYMNASNEKVEKVEWHNCVYWPKNDKIGSWIKKGRKLFVEGELQTRSWEDKQSGQKRYTTEIIVHNLLFLDKAPVEEHNQYAQSEPPRIDDSTFDRAPDLSDIPF